MTGKRELAGFTLIEVMIVVVIIAILTGIAIPSYNDYLIRSRIAHATTGLATKRTLMEQYFQDNHLFTAAPACADDDTNQYFKFTCPILAATAYTLRAQGKGPMTGFFYTVDQANAKTSPFVGAPTGWTAHTPDNCWITGKGGAC